MLFTSHSEAQLPIDPSLVGTHCDCQKLKRYFPPSIVLSYIAYNKGEAAIFYHVDIQ